jgi:hypothetical protein
VFSVGFVLHFGKMFLVTSPPHCTHHIQSLDIAVMGPFKTKYVYAVAQNDWMMMVNMGGGG